MARMKVEFLAQYKGKHGLTLRDRAIGYLPRYAPWACRLPRLSNFASGILRSLLGFTAHRRLPQWRTDIFHDQTSPKTAGREVVLFVDTFNRYYEPENARAAHRVLEAAGYAVHTAQPLLGGRPLCCGRTFLSAGLVEEARIEARRTFEALEPWVLRGVPVVGLEPSCLFSFRDEFSVLLPGTERLGKSAFLFEEFLAREHEAGRLALKLKALPEKSALLHGHCHQKAFDAMPAVQKVLGLVPGLEVRTVETSCCGMAGSFGYEAEHFDISMKMAEMALLPALRHARADTLIVADGTSCRHQILDGAAREALHVARVLEAALA
jgi:Fe-S oxidoreductase